VPDGQWGGQVLLTLHEAGKPARRFAAAFPSDSVSFSTSSADLRVGSGTVTVDAEGRYLVHARARADDGAGDATVDVTVAPAPGAYFPGAALGGGTFVSGYAVAGLRATAVGTICVRDQCERYDGAQAYHDHNWGVWRGVTWQWGAARAGAYTFLYGRVEPADSVASAPPLVVYLVDSTGFLALFRPRDITYVDGRTTRVNGATIRTPSRAEMVDVRGGDTLRIVMSIEDATATDTRDSAVERGEGLAGRALERPYFVQMKGTATLSGRIRGTPLAGRGAGFFETYR
jgi:hypothetical protein